MDNFPISSSPEVPVPSESEIHSIYFSDISNHFWKLHVKTKSQTYKYIPYDEERCRFEDIPLLETTAVFRLEGFNKVEYEESGRFLHASVVEGDGCSFIATQYPYPADDLYWGLCFERGSVLIDLTTSLDIKSICESDGIENEFSHFPQPIIGTILNCKHYSITFIKKEIMEEYPDIILYTYEIACHSQSKKRKLLRLHFTQWYDHRGLDANALRQLIALLEQLPHFNGINPIINCRAGVGRTGTLIAALRMMHRIKTGRTTWATLQQDLDEVILDLRRQRGPDAVQTERQYFTLMQLCVDALIISIGISGY